jgi:hypothetical protein
VGIESGIMRQSYCSVESIGWVESSGEGTFGQIRSGDIAECDFSGSW